MKQRGNCGDYLIAPDRTVGEALERLEQNVHKTLCLTEDGRLVGVVTDGDIRRFLLKSGDLTRPISFAATKSPLFVTGYHEKTARDMVEEKGIQCVPMLDRDGRIHALVFREETLHAPHGELNNAVVIMAGGYGTRLFPYTEILPKPLMPVGNRTITEMIINRFLKFGCQDITLIVNHKKNLIKSYFSETEKDYLLDFVEEQKPLGTGGGLAMLKGRFSEPFFVTYCDNIIEADYRDIVEQHEAEGNLLTMVTAAKTVQVPYGVVRTKEDGAVVQIDEKPVAAYRINAGFYVVSPVFLECIKEDSFCHITDLIEDCVRRGGRVGSYQIEEDCFIDAGRLDDLQSLTDKLR